MKLKLHSEIVLALLLSQFGCASRQNRMEGSIFITASAAESALRTRPTGIHAYNLAVAAIVHTMATENPELFTARTAAAGVSVRLPVSTLPLKRFHTTKHPISTTTVGVPVVLEYSTLDAPQYPPEGLFVGATVTYQRSKKGLPQLSIRRNEDRVTLRGQDYPLTIDSAAAGELLALRAQPLAKTGFSSMIQPAKARLKAGIYLLDPYDPNKIPLLMVHGLQSTPVAFAQLGTALRSDPAFRKNYQIWQFYYPNGTPLLNNAKLLRDGLESIIEDLDPNGNDPATRKIVVLGHSMGGVISHTLVSSSGERLWSSLFHVPAAQLTGNRADIQELSNIMHFERNSRVKRVIFVCAPHRGSPIAGSFAGALGHSLTRLPVLFETGISQINAENPGAMTNDAQALISSPRLSAIRTLSGQSPAVRALAELPIEVPFHTIVGQTRPGAKERGTDGVVPYSSSHLEGAASELVVRSGHGAYQHPDASAEILRILKLELADEKSKRPGQELPRRPGSVTAHPAKQGDLL